MEVWRTVPMTAPPPGGGGGPPDAAGAWEVLFGAARGSLHVRTGAPLQDAVGWWPGPRAGAPAEAAHRASRVVVAVSDGVGSRDCFRSDRGAQLAVACACAVGAELVAVPEPSGPGTPGDEVAVALAAEVVARWTAAVRADLAGAPFRPEELEGTSPDWADAGPLLAYAATLLVAVATPERLLLVQLGDGDVLVVGPGGVVARPVPDDPSSVAGTTSTLSQPDAVEAFRGTVLDLAADPVDLVLMATDGYGNAFADPGWPGRVGRDVHDQLRDDGPADVRGRLGSWVADAASVGGDDATLALVVRAPA